MELKEVSDWRAEYGYAVKLPVENRQRIIDKILEDGEGARFLSYLVSRSNIYESRGISYADCLSRTNEDFAFTKELLPREQESELLKMYTWPSIRRVDERYPLRRFIDALANTIPASTSAQDGSKHDAVCILDTNVLLDAECFVNSSDEYDAEFTKLRQFFAQSERRWALWTPVIEETHSVIKRKFGDDAKIHSKLELLRNDLEVQYGVSAEAENRVSSFIKEDVIPILPQLDAYKLRHKSEEEKKKFAELRAKYGIGKFDQKLLQLAVSLGTQFKSVIIVTKDYDFRGIQNLIFGKLGVLVRTMDDLTGSAA